MTTLLEIDFQSWIVALGHDPAVTARAIELRRRLRGAGASVVCSRYLSRDATDPLRSDPDGPSAAFVPGLGPEPGDPVITKYEPDVFTAPELGALLERLGIRHLVISGIATDHGVRLAALSAAARGLTVEVVADACAGTTADAHVAAVEELRKMGITIACLGAHSKV